MTQPDFFGALREVLVREISGCVDLLRVERLSGGASMETYQLVVETTQGEATYRAGNVFRGQDGGNRQGTVLWSTDRQPRIPSSQ